MVDPQGIVQFKDSAVDIVQRRELDLRRSVQMMRPGRNCRVDDVVIHPQAWSFGGKYRRDENKDEQKYNTASQGP